MSNRFLADKERPIVVGHRGVPALHQENSLAGFRRAVDLGIDAVELDVRLTSDGRAVVCHDDDLERLTGERVSLSALTWDQLSRLRVRSRLPMGVNEHGGQVVVDYDLPQPLALFAEVLAEVGDRVAINIELKLDTKPIWDTRISAVVAAEIGRAGLEGSVVVTSFDLRKLRAVKRANANLVVGFCYDDGMLDMLKRVLPQQQRLALLRAALERNLSSRFVDASIVGADHTLISEQTVDKLHRRGVAIGTHTLFPIGSTTGKPIASSAATEEEVERLVNLGVDWIESDDPERVLAMVA